LDLIGRKLAMNSGELFREYYEDVSAFVGTHEAHEELSEQMAKLKKAMDTVGQVAMKFGEWGMGGDLIKPQLGATEFLEMMGHATIAYLLLDQAVIADEKIKGGDNQSYYRDKIRTAKYFVAQILPEVQLHAKKILTEDTTAMEMEFEVN